MKRGIIAVSLIALVGIAGWRSLRNPAPPVASDSRDDNTVEEEAPTRRGGAASSIPVFDEETIRAAVESEGAPAPVTAPVTVAQALSQMREEVCACVTMACTKSLAPRFMELFAAARTAPEQEADQAKELRAINECVARIEKGVAQDRPAEAPPI
jgi:hypothetical protein